MATKNLSDSKRKQMQNSFLCFLVYNYDINISELCECVGITRQAFYKIMNNTSVPSVVIAMRIVSYLNAEINADYDISQFWHE